MKQVAIFASEHCLFSTIAGPMDLFSQAGVLWNGIVGKQASPYFQVQIVTLDGKPVLAQNKVPVVPSCSIEDLAQPDLILLPSQGLHLESDDVTFARKIAWLQQRYEDGAALASICTGAFTLAETGLLDGLTATTHWGAAKQFSERFPKVNLRTDLMVTDAGRIFCGGGMTADLNLAVYLIEKFCGREVALQSSRCTLVDMSRISQQPFSVFSPEKRHHDKEVLNLQNWIDENYVLNLSIEEMASNINMSPRHLNRRFKKATGETVVKYTQLIRVEAAKRYIESKRISIEEVSRSVGYENISFFRKVFKSVTGLSPTEYRKKFGFDLT